jgi:hypothetical protein
MLKSEVLLPRKSKQKGSVLATVSEGDLQRPDFFRMIGCKMHLGRPERKASTLDYIVVMELPKERTSFEVLNRLHETGIGIISPHAIPGASKLVKLSQSLSVRKAFSVLVGYTDKDSWEKLQKIKPELIIFRVKQEAIEEAVEFFEFLKTCELEAPAVLQIALEKKEEISEAYHELLASLKKKGVWIDSSSDLESRRHKGASILVNK